MSKVQDLNLGGQYPLYVEVDASDVEVTLSQVPSTGDSDTITMANTQDNLINSMDWLKSNINTLTTGVRDAMDISKPDEWSLDFNIGFRGETGIPLITKGEANAALRVHVKWKRQSA